MLLKRKIFWIKFYLEKKNRSDQLSALIMLEWMMRNKMLTVTQTIFSKKRKMMKTNMNMKLVMRTHSMKKMKMKIRKCLFVRYDLKMARSLTSGLRCLCHNSRKMKTRNIFLKKKRMKNAFVTIQGK